MAQRDPARCRKAALFWGGIAIAIPFVTVATYRLFNPLSTINLNRPITYWTKSNQLKFVFWTGSEGIIYLSTIGICLWIALRMWRAKAGKLAWTVILVGAIFNSFMTLTLIMLWAVVFEWS